MVKPVFYKLHFIALISILLCFSCENNKHKKSKEVVNNTSFTLKKANQDYLNYLKTGNRTLLKQLDSLVSARIDSLKQSDSTYLQTLILSAKLDLEQSNFKLGRTKFLKADSLYLVNNLKDSTIKHSIDYYKVYTKSQVNRRLYLNEVLEVIDQYKDCKNKDTLTEMFSKEYLARVYIDYAKYDKAIANLKEAINYFKSKKIKKNLSVAYSVLGVAYDGKEAIDSSLTNYKKSIKIGEELVDPNYNILAANSYNLGLTYNDRLGNSDQSIKYFTKAVTFDSIQNPKNQYLVDDYRNLSAAYLSNYDIENAKKYAEKSLSLAEEVLGESEFYMKASSKFVLANVLIQNNQKEEALTFAKEAFKEIVTKTKENHRYVANANYQLGDLYMQAKDTLNAINYLKKASKIAKDIDRGLFELKANKSLIDLGFYTDKVFKRQDLLLNTKFKNALYYQVEYLIQRINFLKNKSEFEAAKSLVLELKKKYSDDQISAFQQIQLKALQIELLWQSPGYNLEEETNQFIKLVVDSKNNFSNHNNQVYYANYLKESITQTLNSVYKVYQNTNQESYLNLFLKLIEVNKNSVLLEGVQQVKLKNVADVPKELIEKEQQLKEKLQSVYNNIQYSKKQTNLNEELLNKLYLEQQELSLDYENLISDLNTNYPKYASLKRVKVSDNLKSYQTKLHSEEVILEYYIDKNIGYCFKISKENIEVIELKNLDALRDKITQFKNQINNRITLTETSKGISNLVLPKFEKNIKKITIIADDVLTVLPFEVLMQNNKYLVESISISYAGSLMLLEEQKSLKTESKGWAGFAPKYSKIDLTNNVDEVKNIKAIYGGTTYVNEKASKDLFVEEGKNYGVLHLAMHSTLNKTNPMNNKLLFNEVDPNQSLTAAEIYSLHLNANLAVLSACNTGFGKLEKSEGLMSMSRAFTYTGVPSTIMSLWKVPDKETSIIMTSFYKYLKQGKTKDKALQLAKVDYLNNTGDVALKHPYYWSGFVVTGDTIAVKNEGNSSSYWWLILLIIPLGFVIKSRLN